MLGGKVILERSQCKHARKNLEDDGKVALSPSSTPKELQTAPSLYIRVHMEAILMCLSCVISVRQSLPSSVGGSINQSNSNLSSSRILGSCECLIYLTFLEDRTNQRFCFLSALLQIALKKILISGKPMWCNKVDVLIGPSVSLRKDFFLVGLLFSLKTPSHTQ